MYENQRAVALEWLNEAVAIAGRPAAERAVLWDEWDARRDRTRGTSFWYLTAGLPMFMMPALSVDTAVCALTRPTSAPWSSCWPPSAIGSGRASGQSRFADIDPEVSGSSG